MTLVQRIMDGALDGSIGLSEVLLRCKVLSSRIGDANLATWTDREIKGYRGMEDIPDYRTVSATLHANGSNSAWSVKGREVPLYLLPENLQHSASTVVFVDGVSALEAMKDRDDIAYLASDAVRYWLENEGGGNLTITSVYLLPFPRAITGVLSTIRSKIVDSLLLVEQQFPNLEDAQIANNDEIKEKVAEAFAINVSGGNPVINIGDFTTIQQDNRQVTVNDLDSLHAYLESEGFDPSDFAELDDIVVDATAVEEIKEGRGRIAEWSKKAAGKVAKNTGSAIYKVATDVASKAVTTYLGLN